MSILNINGQKFFTNGYVVLSVSVPSLEHVYLGLDDYQWPFEEDDQSFTALCKDMQIPPAGTGVNVSTCLDNCKYYYTICVELGLQARLLLVCTQLDYPCVSVDLPSDDWSFLGFDIAEPRGTHSVLRHEVITGPSPRLIQYRSLLNEHGLIGDLGTAEKFLRDRESELQKNADGMCESYGDEGWFTFLPVAIYCFQVP